MYFEFLFKKVCLIATIYFHEFCIEINHNTQGDEINIKQIF